MASKAISRLQLPRQCFISNLQPVARRNLTFATARTNVVRKPSQSPLQQSFRRSYADSAPVKKRAGFLRWTWRLVQLSLLGGAGWVAYEVYLLRTPQEQFEQDPKKKTLVILGKYHGF
jgi:hypothetical protein